MGLGLSIVRESMEAMGGIVSVESVEGEGTTFSSRVAGHLPRQRIPARPPKPSGWHFLVTLAGRLPGAAFRCLHCGLSLPAAGAATPAGQFDRLLSSEMPT